MIVEHTTMRTWQDSSRISISFPFKYKKNGIIPSFTYISIRYGIVSLKVDDPWYGWEALDPRNGTCSFIGLLLIPQALYDPYGITVSAKYRQGNAQIHKAGRTGRIEPGEMVGNQIWAKQVTAISWTKSPSTASGHLLFWGYKRHSSPGM